MNRFALILALVVAGCSPQIEDGPPLDSTAVTVNVNKQAPAPTSAPRQVREPEINEVFSNPETLAQWHDSMDAEITSVAAEPDPREMFEAIAATYTISLSNLEPLFGSKDIWGADYNPNDEYTDPDPDPVAELDTLEQAGYLERQDQKWHAAQIYIAHGNNADANRCAKLLFDEGSYKVAAMVAVMTGDMDMMTAATTKMVDARYVTKVYDVVRYAYDNDKIQAGRHIVDTHGYDLVDVLGEQTVGYLARTSQPDLLAPIIESSLALSGGDSWNADQYGSGNLAAGIVTLGRTDPEQARAFAARYIKIPHINVMLLWKCGEGCYVSPLIGTLELYQLIKGDPQLKQIYLDRTREFAQEAFPAIHVDGEERPRTKSVIHGVIEYAEWNNGEMNESYVFTYLMAVKATGDQDLIALWTEMVNDFGHRQGDYSGGPMAFEREIGRGILGLSVNPTAPDLDLSQQYLLARLTGASAPDLSPLWDEPRDSRRYYSHDPPNASLTWLLNMFLNGSMDQNAQAALLATYELVAENEYSTPTRLLSKKFEAAMSAHYGVPNTLNALMIKPDRAFYTNKIAVDERQRLMLPPIDLYPVTEDDVLEIIAPHLLRMETELPVAHARHMAAHPPRP
ncbi:MAG: hypothetical protein HQ488_03255 [Parcubacteria group bacterium]|nr:hypothetical protein [Parcubacteria group bacterium]